MSIMPKQQISNKINLLTKHVLELPEMDPASRRQALMQIMHQKKQECHDCGNCPGTCCTMKSNSMQISTLEAIDILIYCLSQNWDLQQLIQDLENTVTEFRLDYLIQARPGQMVRKNYTCTFFCQTSLACKIPRDFRPYGCLAFNPVSHDQRGLTCCTDVSGKQALENLEKSLLLINQKLRRDCCIIDEKNPIPVAVLNLLKLVRN